GEQRRADVPRGAPAPTTPGEPPGALTGGEPPRSPRRPGHRAPGARWCAPRPAEQPAPARRGAVPRRPPCPSGSPRASRRRSARGAGWRSARPRGPAARPPAGPVSSGLGSWAPSGPGHHTKPGARWWVMRHHVYELRQYPLHPGQREVLISLFDRHLVEPQEAVGMRVVGQFRDLDHPDRFVWLRSFEDMVTRDAALRAFYGGARGEE